MLYAADSNPKIFTEFNKENRMSVFSGEILKGTKTSLSGEMQADGKTIMQMHDS